MRVEPALVLDPLEGVCNAAVNYQPTRDNRHERPCSIPPTGLGERGRELCTAHRNVEKRWLEGLDEVRAELSFAERLADTLSSAGCKPFIRYVESGAPQTWRVSIILEMSTDEAARVVNLIPPDMTTGTPPS
jgi:hypothetical protein